MSSPPPAAAGRVSVIMAVCNGERFVAQAIASILAQTRLPDEVVCVDDGSTDGTAAILHALGATSAVPIRTHRQPNGGQPAALNAGLALAGGDYLAFLDHDDLWLPDKLAAQWAAFQAEPGLDMVVGRTEQFVEPDAPPALHLAYGQRPALIAADLPGAMLVRRDVFARVGPFDPRLRIGSNLDWIARARERGLVVQRLEAIVLRRRIHGQNLGLRERDQQAYGSVVRAALERRRGRPC